MRFRWTLGGLILVTSLFSRSTPAADWPQFLGPDRNGSQSAATLADQWPASGPKVLWRTDVGAGWASPVIAGGKLIFFHRVGDNERVDCLDASTGKKIWTAEYPTAYQDDFNFDEGPRGTPAIAGKQVFTFGAEGKLTAWDFETGKQLWQVDTKAQFQAGKGFFGMACSPLVEGDVVILNVGGQNGAGIIGFDRNTGKVVWKATDDEASYSSPVGATVGGKRVVFSLTRAGLVALDPAGGKVYFKYPWRPRMEASVNAAAPLIVADPAGTLVFLSVSYDTGGVLLRLNDKDLSKPPTVVWKNDESLSCHYATPVIRDGFLYGYHGRQERGPSLRCVELATGRVRWSEDGFGAGTVTLAGGKLLLLTDKGQLIQAAANPDGFKELAKAQILPFNTRAYPALTDGLFYARSKDKLVCVDLRK